MITIKLPILNIIDITNYVPLKNYEKKLLISKKGEVFSIKLKRLLKPFVVAGYLSLSLRSGDGKLSKKHVHVLVAETFLIKPIKIKKPEVDHINGNKFDNSVENLRWCTRSVNVKNTHKNNPDMFDAQKRKILKLDDDNNIIQSFPATTDF